MLFKSRSSQNKRLFDHGSARAFVPRTKRRISAICTSTLLSSLISVGGWRLETEYRLTSTGSCTDTRQITSLPGRWSQGFSKVRARTESAQFNLNYNVSWQTLLLIPNQLTVYACGEGGAYGKPPNLNQRPSIYIYTLP
ncbi:hypothetical protein BDR07DRAFT_1398082 [Suillus spraguei]|nr:hypothetical protein BDR07DRAFT_1398082 [Suillus spraguei]